jgi:hypothetical protein
MRKRESRPYSETELRKYRSDKRKPRRLLIRTEEDLGDKIRIRKYSTPRVKREERNIPKEWSGKWEDIYKRNGLWIRHSKITERFYAYGYIDGDYEYLGELDQPDLWKLLVELGKSLGAFREELHMQQNCKRYTKYVLNLRKMNQNARQSIQ